MILVFEVVITKLANTACAILYRLLEYLPLLLITSVG